VQHIVVDSHAINHAAASDHRQYNNLAITTRLLFVYMQQETISRQPHGLRQRSK